MKNIDIDFGTMQNAGKHSANATNACSKNTKSNEIFIDKISIKTYSYFADKIAIFGGSFDPPHLAHFEIIKWLSAHFRQAIIIPAYQNPLKNQAMIPFDTRLKWCEIMCQHIKQEINATNITTSDIEGKYNRVVFAYELATYFYSKYFSSKHSNESFFSDFRGVSDFSDFVDFMDFGGFGDVAKSTKDSSHISPLCFVIGEDALSQIHQWRHIAQLAKLVDFVMLKRDGTKSKAQNPATLQSLKQQSLKQQPSKQNPAINAIDFTNATNNADFKNMDFTNAKNTIAKDTVRVFLVDFSPNDLLKKSLPFLPNENLNSTFLRESLIKKTFSQNKKDKTQSQILNAIPQCLHNEVIEFFKKTALQFR